MYFNLEASYLCVYDVDIMTNGLPCTSEVLTEALEKARGIISSSEHLMGILHNLTSAQIIIHPAGFSYVRFESYEKRFGLVVFSSVPSCYVGTVLEPIS